MDIKPSNLLLSDEDQIVIVDYDLCDFVVKGGLKDSAVAKELKLGEWNCFHPHKVGTPGAFKTLSLIA